MLPSHRIELAIYRHISKQGSGAATVTLPALTEATKADSATLIERLRDLEGQHRVELSKYNGGNPWPYAEFTHDITSFFSTGQFRVEVLPQGRRYFEELEASDAQETSTMTKQTIFVSCGQRTEEERKLGGQICDVINDHPGFCAYFADLQSSLRGLNENILDTLGGCAGFVTVMHPRGAVFFSEGQEFVRASVWIEQEIAIAAYIQRTRKEQLHVAAYAHQSIGREGLRELLQLNPVLFTDSSEVLAHLKGTLRTWQPVELGHKTRGDFAKAHLKVARGNTPQLRTATVFLSIENIGRGRIREYAGTISVPADTLTFNSGGISGAIPARFDGYRSFRHTEKEVGRVSIHPGDDYQVISVEVAVDHLSVERRAQVLAMDVIGDVEAEGEVLQIRMPLSGLMVKLA